MDAEGSHTYPAYVPLKRLSSTKHSDTADKSTHETSAYEADASSTCHRADNKRKDTDRGINVLPSRHYPEASDLPVVSHIPPDYHLKSAESQGCKISDKCIKHERTEIVKVRRRRATVPNRRVRSVSISVFSIRNS